MTKQEIFEKCTNAGILQVATVDGDKARVRTVMLFRADDEGIIFHTAEFKDLFRQIQKNPKVEFCFNCKSEMIRISGELEIVEDTSLRDEIIAHPTREFVRNWLSNGLLEKEKLKVLRMCHGVATVWTMETNFKPKEYIQL